MYKPRHKLNGQARLSFSSKNSQLIYEALLTGIKGNELEAYGTETQKRFKKNYDFLLTKITEYSPECKANEIQKLMEKIKSLNIIFIKCADRSTAYRLFESINATGISLASTDLIKNSIFETLDGTEYLEKTENGWSEMAKQFNEDASVLKTYIRHHWISSVGYTSHASLFDDFEKKYKSSEDVKKYTNLLYLSAEIYQALRTAEIDSLPDLPKRRFDKNEIRETLEFLSYLGVDQIYSVLLYSYKKNPDGFLSDLTRFVAFQFLYKFIPGSPSVPEKKYFSDYCSGKKTKTQVISGLMSLCRDQEKAFKANLLEKTKYIEGKSGHIQFILEKYLYYKGEPEKFSKPTIEHIIAQDLSAGMIKSLGGDRKLAVKLIHQLGNLTILERRKNSGEEFSNLPFKDKVPSYKKDLFIGNQDIVKYSFDSEPAAAINKRGGDLASIIYKIFLNALKTGKWERETP